MRLNDIPPSKNFQSTVGKPEYYRRRKVDPEILSYELHRNIANVANDVKYKRTLKNLSQSYSDAVKGKRDREPYKKDRER